MRDDNDRMKDRDGNELRPGDKVLIEATFLRPFDAEAIVYFGDGPNNLSAFVATAFIRKVPLPPESDPIATDINDPSLFAAHPEGENPASLFCPT